MIVLRCLVKSHTEVELNLGKTKLWVLLNFVSVYRFECHDITTRKWLLWKVAVKMYKHYINRPVLSLCRRKLIPLMPSAVQGKYAAFYYTASLRFQTKVMTWDSLSAKKLIHLISVYAVKKIQKLIEKPKRENVHNVMQWM